MGLDTTTVDTVAAMAPAPDLETSVSKSDDADSHGAGSWDLSSNHDAMDDVQNVTLSLSASESPRLAFPYNDEATELVIRCRKNKTDLYVVTHVPVKTSYDDDFDDIGSRVRYRFDGGKPTASYWSESTDHSAVFSPDPITLSKRLAGTKTWIFEFTPYDAASVTATFSTDGLASILPRVAGACRWK